jgi:hypothetical protein
LELRHAEGSTAWGDGSKQEDKTTGAAITGAAFHVRDPQDPTKGTTCMVDTRELPQEINAAELAAIWAALRAGYTVIATDSLTSLLQIARAARHPDSLEQHRYRFLLMEIAAAPGPAPGPHHPSGDTWATPATKGPTWGPRWPHGRRGASQTAARLNGPCWPAEPPTA